MPITDIFKGFTIALGDPISNAVAVAPSDTADLAQVTRALYIGTAGNARVTLASGTVADFAGLAVGWHPMRVARVHASGTTASNIIGCW